MPRWVAGGLISSTSALMLFSPLIRNLVGKHGTKIVIVVAQLVCACALVMLYITGEPRPVGLIYWIIASLGASTPDVVGNIPFMRIRERSEMTMIFSTWREASNLLTPLLVTLVLLVAPIEVFYLLLALMLFTASYVASFLPRRL